MREIWKDIKGYKGMINPLKETIKAVSIGFLGTLIFVILLSIIVILFN